MIKKAIKELNWRILLFGVFFVYFYDLLLYRYAPKATMFINNTVLMPLMVILIGIIFFTTNIKKEKLFWASVIVFGFLCALCLLNNAGIFPHGILIAFATIGCFFIPYILQKKHLEGFIKAFMASFIALYFVFGILSVITIIKMLLGERWALGELLRVTHWADGRLYVITHPNFTGLSFIIAAFFCVVLLHGAKKKLVKIMLYIAMALSVICMILSNSRTALLAGCVMCGVLLGSLFYQKAFDWQIKKKVIGTALAVICGALVLLILNSVVLSSFNLLSSIPRKENTPVSASEPTQNTPTTLPDRDIIGESMQETLNGRGYLWEGIFNLLENEPTVLLKGIAPFNHRIMERLIPYIPQEGLGNINSYTHTHSGYFYILLAYGVPGLILVGALFILLFKNSFSLVFLKKTEDGLPVYLFPAFITLIIAAEFVECFITNNEIGFIMPVFFLLAGCICFYARKGKAKTI